MPRRKVKRGVRVLRGADLNGRAHVWLGGEASAPCEVYRKPDRRALLLGYISRTDWHALVEQGQVRIEGEWGFVEGARAASSPAPSDAVTRAGRVRLSALMPEGPVRGRHRSGLERVLDSEAEPQARRRLADAAVRFVSDLEWALRGGVRGVNWDGVGGGGSLAMGSREPVSVSQVQAGRRVAAISGKLSETERRDLDDLIVREWSLHRIATARNLSRDDMLPKLRLALGRLADVMDGTG